jgi:hypothetical protein
MTGYAEQIAGTTLHAGPTREEERRRGGEEERRIEAPTTR